MKLFFSKIINLNLIKHIYSPVLLYHSVFEKVPSDLAEGLHNIKPNDLEKQLVFLKKNYEIVSIDDYYKAKNKKGLAAVTFDDGYKNVIENAYSIIKKLKIPITIFLITSFLENKEMFWRDKIRFIMNNNLTEEAKKFFSNKKINIDNFYRETKNKIHNSILINNLIDEFIKSKKIILENNPYQITSIDDLIDDDLVSYGSHSFKHYVLSTLSFEEQYEDLSRSKNFINQLDSKKSNLFSIPFGSINDFDENTKKFLKI